ncbi:transmembrane protein 131 isoform X1 [Diabrotica virgifera virgifera]|uniref:Transmembrane protein 131 n=1 Tax=Diabrotica virgifera virgifera TaxID=50390 RepID=A0ABM5KNW6_DIAVI|nr:transmembrane protein 131 isoform X1 [Diabrotica virgifera virgifera]
MFSNYLPWYIFTLSLLELIIKTHPTLHDSSHGFISKNPRYFDEEFSHLHEEFGLPRTSKLSDVPLKFHMKFEPTFLDFKKRPFGIPHMEKVTLFNIDKNKSIDMTSISGSTVHFHSSFFADRNIPPKGNTSFNVVFLGREEGYIESDLYIHTSEGFLKYNVRGASTYSHYRIRPIGVKLPLNSTFAPLIFLHNPHLEPLQIVEVHGEGGGFHLELPNGESEGAKDLWKLDPHETKAIIRVFIQPEILQNYTAYVRIRLNKPDLTLVVPVEVEVTEDTEIIHPSGYVDLGLGGHLDHPTEINLCLHNPNTKHVRVHSIYTESKALKLQYYNIRLPPARETEEQGDQCVDVGTIIVDWKTAYETKDFSGKITVSYRNGKNKSEIPYHMTILKGGLTYDPLTTTYFINDKTVDLSARSFKVKNEFDEYIYVADVIFPRDIHHYFKIQSLWPKVIKPGDETNLFNIKLKNNIRLSDLQLQSFILLKTNISHVRVSLVSYNGKLQVHLPFKSKDFSLEIGLLGFNTKKEVYFMIVNHNPVTLNVKHVHSSIPMTHADILGCGSGDFRLVLFSPSFPNLTKCHNLKAGHYAIIKVTITTTQVEGQVWGDIYVETQFENLKIPVHFKIAPGKLEIGAEKLVFDQCFPGKLCTHPLKVHSSFNDPMVIEDVITLPPDKRISSRLTSHILAKTSKVVGHIFLNAELGCHPECYTGLQSDTTAQWLKMFSLSKFVYDFDLHLVNTFYNRYLNLTANGTKRWQNISMRLDTSEVRGHVFKSRLKMSWPSLLVDNNLENKSSIVFPRTQVGNMSYHNITIRNPASVTVVVQLVLGSDYPNYLDLLADMPPNLDVESIYDRFFPTGFFFPNDTRHEQINYFNEMLGVNVHPESIPVLLPPGETFTFPVGFYAEDGHCHSAVVLLRNNLTILEVVRLNAKGVQPLFKFGNRKPGSLQPLTFEMTERHFRDCEKQKFYTGDPNFTVKRTFTARNIGDVTLYVNSFHINEYPCEGYGFKVMDCESFVLYPNQTKKIDIAFTPDLTLSKISRMLQLGTSLNMPVNYTLYTTIPPLYLSLCSDLIARPNWEVYLSYLAVVAMSLLLFIIVSVATLDAERIKRQAMDSFIFPSNSSVQPVLDLRLVGQQIREEIQSQKPVTVSKEETKSDQVEKEVTKEEVPEVNSKPEVERYTVLVPTTGKAKKKLAKRNSNESSPVEGSYMQVADKVEKKKERHPEPKHKVKETKDEKEVVKVDEKEKKHVQNNIKEKEVKKSHFHNKKHTKNTVVPAYEEETSSSTTESSGSLNEDPEKENNQRISVKVCSKTTTKRDRESQKTSTTNGGFVDGNPNHTNEFKHVHFNHSNHHNKLKHQKLLAKAAKANEKQIKENKDFEEHHKTIEHALSTPVNNKHHSHQKDRSEKKKERISKERKEKGFHKKSLEKNKQIHNELTDKHDKHEKHEKNEKHEKHKNPLSFNVPLPTPMTSTVWGESRAKFSDVVARSESSCSLFSNNNRPLSHTSTAKSAVTKPTMYVEPYKQTTPTELGPIGSRRTDRRSSSENNRRSMGEGSFGHDNFLHTNGLRTEPANSFFSDEIRLDNVGRENGYLGDLNTWNQQQTFGSALEPGFTSSEANTIMEEDYEEGNDIDPWNQNLLNTSSYWESYNPLLNDSPLLPDTPLLNENSLLSEATNALPTQNNVTSASNVYLWGSSSVWQPWAPETTRTPTRTPPGFDEFLHRKDEQSSQQPQQSSPRESYSPFNISPLWNQQQTNPWNYSQGQ